MASKLGRLTRLGTLTTRVGSSYLGQKVAGLFLDEDGRKIALDRLHVQNAERIASNLGSLKGAAMKVGQAFAQIAEGYGLPDEARAVLGKLHDRAEPIPFEQIQRRVEAELHGGLDTLFRSFDREPLGTASLGQAHGAELPDGTPVVVKVLHEGIEGSVHADLGAVKAMLQAGRVLRRPAEEVDAIFAEIEARLAEELDYRVEAANLVEFGRYFADDPEIAIPRVHPGWSTARVLTMERLGGRPLPVFQATASEAAKQRAGSILVRTFLRMEYVHRAVHADPHPGNYLFHPDGRVGMIDFGCVRRYELEWMFAYGQCGIAVCAGDQEACMQAAMRIGALAARSAEDERTLWEMCQHIGRPFLGGPFTMGGPDDDIQDRLTAMSRRVVAARMLRAPRELVFLHRALGGTYQIVKSFRTRGDWRPVLESAFDVCRADVTRSRALAAGAARG